MHGRRFPWLVAVLLTVTMGCTRDGPVAPEYDECARTECPEDEDIDPPGGGLTPAVEQFHWADFRIVAPSASGNLFDVIADVTWTHEVSRTVRRGQAFYSGVDRTFIFRFGAERIGTWAGLTTSSVPELDGLEFKIAVTPATNPSRAGYHVFMPSMPTAWAQQTRTGVRIRPPRLVMWDPVHGFWDDTARMRAQVDVFADQHGFTGAHVTSVASTWFEVSRSNFRIRPHVSDPDPRTFEALEALIDAWLDKGGSVHIWAFSDSQRGGSPLQLPGGPSGVVAKRLDRYIAARLGPVPGWSMGHGFDLQEWATAAMLREWIERVSASGWHHWVGGRYGGPAEVRRGSYPGEGVHLGTVADAPPQYAGWEQWAPLLTGPDVPARGFAAVPDRPHFSEDRFRLLPDVPQVNTRQHLVSEAAQLQVMELFGMAGFAAIYGRYFEALLDPAGVDQTSQPWPNPAAVKAVNDRIDAHWDSVGGSLPR